VLTADGGQIAPARVEPYYSVLVPTAPARPIAVAPAKVDLARTGETLRLTVTPPSGASRLVLTLKATVPLQAASLNGVTLKPLAGPGKTTRILWQGRPEPLALTIKAAAPGRLDLAYAALTPSWPSDAKPLPPAPEGEMQFDVSGSTLVTGTHRLGW
jgi:hypothetical protein